MRKILLIGALLLAAILVYNYFTTGRIGLAPSSSASVSEKGRRLDDLARRLKAAGQTFRQAERTAGTMGLDTTSDAESARQEVERVEKEVDALKGVPGTKVENERLEGLGREVAELKRTMGLGR